MKRGGRASTCPAWRAGAAGVALLGSVAGPAGGAPPAPGSGGCTLVSFAEAHAQAAIDGRTILLDDGRQVRLAGIAAPPAGVAADGLDPRSALHALVAGKNVMLKHLQPATDRYGRIVAWAYLPGAGGESVAQTLVARGLARTAIGSREGGCAPPLLAAEAAARAAKLGLWGDPRYELRRAQDPGDIATAWGRFSLVEGRVLSVRESGGTIYVNFGRRWTEDFTVTISKRNEPLFAAAGLSPKTLSGRRVRVRGVIELRGGPWIEAVRPEQVEVVSGD